MANSDAQTEAIYNAQNNNAGYISAYGEPSGASVVETVVSGTALQIDSDRNADVYINITTSAALKVEMGPTSACAITVSASQSSALGVISLFVPAGWYIKCTGTVTNYTVTSVLR